MVKRFSIIAGVAKNSKGIGLNGKLPWNVKGDLKYFQKITQTVDNLHKRNAVIMGRRTFESIERKPLYGRLNICISTTITSNTNVNPDFIFCKSLDNALEIVSDMKDIEKVFVIGGEALYKIAIKHPFCEELFINEIDIVANCDTFFPKIDDSVYTFYDQFTICPGVIGNYYRRAEFI